MTNAIKPNKPFYQTIIQNVHFSLLEELTCDPQGENYGTDKSPRQVTSGHYVEVAPTPLPNPLYIAHSSSLFEELGFAKELASAQDFVKFFSGDLKAIIDTHQKKYSRIAQLRLGLWICLEHYGNRTLHPMSLSKW
jgi:hypothetical protein